MKVLKKLLIGVLCGAICLVGAACGKTPGTEPDDGPIGDVDENKQITLRIESAAPLKSNYQALLRSEEEGTQLYNQALFTKRLVDGFKTKYPNVKLQFIEDGWGDALFQAQQLYIRDYNAGGKMAVDIMIGETYMGYFAENGVFAELEAEKFSDVIEGACADVTIDGKLYGVPMCTGIMGLQYNTTILTEAGIAEEDWVPSTWDELLENCRIVSEYAKTHGKTYGGIVMNNVAGMSGAFRATPFLRAAGGDILDASGNLTINSDSNVEAFTYLRSLAQYAYADSLTCDSEDTLQYYFTNKNYGAYMIEGQWSMANAPDNIKSAPLPSKNADGTG
ncbi:MAG: ABC transporter substrate-binding protein, partial [Candidatus Gallimonas sp.]